MYMIFQYKYLSPITKKKSEIISMKKKMSPPECHSVCILAGSQVSAKLLSDWLLQMLFLKYSESDL